MVTSPHCFHTFKNEYPQLGGDFEVVHFIQYLSELARDGRLKYTKKLDQKVTYHDSCCLGRYDGIYDEPRQILEGLGVELVEMEDTRQYALCCGGCAGGLWMETPKGERFSDLRVEQAIKTGASQLAISCPYCMANFQDSVLTMDKGDVIEVKDIVELVEEAI